jgi:hypothetical protein
MRPSGRRSLSDGRLHLLGEELRDSRRLKKPVSEAAADVSTGGVASGYVEDAYEARTKLAGFFSLLVIKNGPLLCGTPALPSDQSDVQQSFSRPR